MKIGRIAMLAVFACVLGGCATYDAGYRQGYADADQRVIVAGDDTQPFADYADFDGYGYPYAVAGFADPWLFGFGFAGSPWFYRPWYAFGYPYAWYGWHRWGHHHWHGHGQYQALAAGRASARAVPMQNFAAPMEGFGNFGRPPLDLRGEASDFASDFPVGERGLRHPPQHHPHR